MLSLTDIIIALSIHLPINFLKYYSAVIYVGSFLIQENVKMSFYFNIDFNLLDISLKQKVATNANAGETVLKIS